MDREVAAEPGMAAEPAAAQQRRGRDRARGDDHQRRRDPHLAAVGAPRRDADGRPASPRTCFTCSPETIRAPASQAWGRAFRWTPPLALLGSRSRTGRTPGSRGRCDAGGRSASPAPRLPRARVPRCGRAPPSAPGRRRSSLRRRRPRAEQLEIGEGEPGSSCQRGHRAGGRKQVPELITVVPPTARPSGSAIGGCRTPSSCRRRGRCGEAVERVGAADRSAVQRSPSSTITVSSPARASFRAAKAPPAPEPITMASQLAGRRPLGGGDEVEQAGRAGRARGGSRPRRSRPRRHRPRGRASRST